MFTSSNSIFNTPKVSDKLKNLTDSLKDTSANLKSLDYLLLSPSRRSLHDFDQRPSDIYRYSDKSCEDLKETNKSINKIEESLNNISTNQSRMEWEIKQLNSSNQNKDFSPPRRAASTTHIDYVSGKSDPFNEASASVDNKLKLAQEKLRNERASVENRNSTFVRSIDLSADLKSALFDRSQTQNKMHQVDKEQMNVLTKRLVHAESDNATLKFEFESLKRQFLNESGAKNTLITKFECSKSTIRDLEEEICALRKEIDITSVESDINRKKAESNVQLQDRISKMQFENEQFKQNRHQCSHLPELEELRKQKDKAERKQGSLQDQMSETMKQIDCKQSHISRLMDEVRDLQEQLSRSKATNQDLEHRFHEEQSEIRLLNQVIKDAKNKIEDLECALIELEADKSKGFSIRDDEIERIENQSKRLKNEIEKMNVHLRENSALIGELHNDNELQRQQLNNGNSQIEALRKEMESLLKARSIQDEVLKRRENDNESYHCENGDLKALLEKEERTSEKFKYDAEVYSQELCQTRETIAIQEERLSLLSGVNLSQKEELFLSKSEISDQRNAIGKLENQISYLNRQISDYREREENIDVLKRRLAESQESQERVTHDMVNKTKKIEFDRSSHIKKLEQLLDAERGASRVLMTKCDRQLLEIKRLHQEYWDREQLVQEFRKKYTTVKEEMEHMIKQEVIEKDRLRNHFNDEIMEREEEISVTKDKYTDVIEERDQILRWIINDIDGVVELLSQYDVLSDKNGQLKSSNYLLTNQTIDLKACPPSASALSTLGGLDVSKSFIDIKSKVSWIRSEVNAINTQLQNHKDVNDELTCEIKVANDRLRIYDSERNFTRDLELEEARKCISNLKMREKNEINLQLKCDRLQEELHQVRQYLSATLGEHCLRSSYH